MSQSFIENVAVLGLTALITGFLIPFIFKRIDERKQKELEKVEESKRLREKKFDADLSRQSKIIEAQSQMLDNLSKLLWEWQFLYISLTYYHGVSNKELYQNAMKQYDEKVMSIMVNIRSEVSRSLRLVPQETYQELVDLFHKLYEVDGKIRPLIEKEARGGAGDTKDSRAWYDLNQYVAWQFSKEVDQTISKLASDLELNVRKPIESILT